MTTRPLRPAGNLPELLADELGDRIVAGEWAPGQRLPSEHGLCEEYGVSRASVRTALQRLAELGLIRTVHGSGSVVTSYGRHIRASLRQLTSMSEVIARQGHDCEIVYRTRAVRPATPEEASKLEIDPGTAVFAFERAFTSDTVTVAYEDGVLPADVLPEGVDAEAVQGSIFAFLEPLGLLPDRALTEVRAVHDPALAWLDDPPDPPTYLCLDQVQFLPDGRAISWSRTHFLDGHVRFNVLRTR